MFCLRRVLVQSAGNSIFRNIKSYTRRDRDPGIAARKKLLAVEDTEDIPDFDDLETDFMHVDRSHIEHEREMKYMKEKQKHFIVRQKYFKEKYPNFLTWHDKEQICYLHRSNPEEWTVERLSEGFPALPDVIMKVIKSNYKKETQNKVTNHDKAVQTNWELFKNKGMPNLPKELVLHLHKFTNRALNFKPFVLPKPPKDTIEVKSQNVRTDFADIITSYQRLKQPALQLESETTADPPPSSNQLPKYFSRKNPLTLSQLQENLNKKAEMGKEMDEEEKQIVTKMKMDESKRAELQKHPNPEDNKMLSENKETETGSSVIDLSQQKYKSATGVQLAKKTQRDLSHLNYPERINIPQHVLKKGSLYKLNDCYYDDDGEFLYRVPGMY